MCGIVGYVGFQDAASFLIDGLRKLVSVIRVGRRTDARRMSTRIRTATRKTVLSSCITALLKTSWN